MLRPDHTFAICAYGESPYLRECIESLLAQEGQRSEVYLATSTPSAWLSRVAADFGLALHVNEGERGIGQDWNFAYAQATGAYVTIAHQDDVYLPGYAAEAVRMLGSCERPLIFFTNYAELRGGARVDDNRLLRVKRRLLRPLEDARNYDNVRVRRRALSLGSAICCPSVCVSRDACPDPPFRTTMQSNLDWDAWELLSRRPGCFCYSPQILVCHRVHAASATSRLIEDHTRAREDLEMLERFWPRPVALALSWLYALGAASNAL